MENRDAMLVVTTFDPPPGRDLERVLGPCWGIAVRSRNVFGTLRGVWQSFRGGEVIDFTQLATESRDYAVRRLMHHASELGANAVLGMRFDSVDLLQNTTEVLAYGTAVVLSPSRDVR
jgi:uncharacterized protein YbjQ (UPF0145 family)